MLSGYSLDFPRAWGTPPVTAQLKAEPEDFYVEEVLGFDPSGEGEHVYLFIEKRNYNTQKVAELLAKHINVSLRDVSYSGMKDRRAVTRQWFSVYLPKKEWIALDGLQGNVTIGDGFQVLCCTRHSKKLRRGDHRANRFRICLRHVQGELALLDTRLKIITENGAPNYYGEQRFGHQGKNLHQAESFLAKAKGKQQGFQDRLLVSVARSWLFNQILSARVAQQSWNHCIEGEPETFPTSPLWGRGRLSSTGQLQVLEKNIVSAYPLWSDFLEHCGLQQERRPCCLLPEHFRYQWATNVLILEFTLSTGGYATALLRELCRLLPENNGSGML